MIISLALALLAIASGTIATYLYEDDASLAPRLCSGAVIGLTIMGLVGFVFASFIGLTGGAIILTELVLTSSLLVLVDNNRRQALQSDLSAAFQSANRFFRKPDRTTLGYVLFYLVTAIIFWRIFERAVIFAPEGIFTGLLNNFGDLPFHLSVITSFAYGNNFPPVDPTFAGVRFTYPFLTDFISAMFVRCGMNLRQSILIENFILAMAFVGLVHRWAYLMLHNRLAAIITPLIVLLNGGFGWLMIWQSDKLGEEGLFGVMQRIASFTIIPDTTWRWGNAITTLLVPQRGMLLGLPLAIMVFTQWWLATEAGRGEGAMGRAGGTARGRSGEGETRGRGEGEKVGRRSGKTQEKNARHGKGRRLDASHLPRFSVSPRPRVASPLHRMAAAGVIAGLLPLAHAHTFVVVVGVGFCIGLLQMRWREWAVFLVLASVVALPQMWWSTHNSAVDAKKFFEWQFGWDRGKQDAVWFWFKNTGLFIPLVITALVWRGKNYLVSKRLLLFYLPFTLCFIVPNVLKMAPWIWDNIKVLFYWWVASAPLVAMFLAYLWERDRVSKLIASALFFFVVLAGSLDVAVIALGSQRYEIFNAQGIRFAEIVRQSTPPRALIVHAPVHNHPVFLTGRRSLMGYPGHIWTHGLEFTEREGEVRRIYSGAPDAIRLIEKLGIQYAVIGPHERNVLSVNEQFFARFAVIGEVGEYRLFKIKP